MNNITEATLKKSDRGEWVRLFTLTYLRWMAVIGQTFAVVIGYFILKIDFSILICLSLILLSSLLNLNVSSFLQTIIFLKPNALKFLSLIYA